MEKETGHKRGELIKWTVSEYYHNFVYIAHAAKVAENYREIMKTKK